MMQAYSKEDLYKKNIQEETSEAYLHSSISKESYAGILASYTTSLYTPNLFIRIALAVLILVAIIFSGLLLAMIFQMSLVPMFLLFSIIIYAALELLVASKLYYNAGVDNLLIFFSAVFITSAFLVNHYDVAASAAAMIFCLYLSIRFTDAFMAVLSYLALLTFIFLLYIKIGNIAKTTVPFLIIIVSASVYSLMKKLLKDEKQLFYKYCCKTVLIVSLITIYTAGNYCVIKELSNEMFGLHLSLNDSIPFGWFFWSWTFVIPVTYVLYGIKKKDLIFIRAGLVLVAAGIFTFRYYYHIVPVEIAMLAGGLILVVLSYAIIKYLKIPKQGFGFDKNTIANKESINLKSLIITEVSGKKANADAGVEFGGGSFGSGGAGGNY